ncbi:MAG: ABC transporter substrate-binding protein, partial [Gaiellaceae bacterium]
MLRRRLSARSIATAVLAVAVVALLAACGGGDESAATTAATEAGGGGERAQVTFMLPIPVRTVATFPFNVAEAAGFYEEENLEVETLTADSAAFAIQQMAAGKVDIALSTA